MTHMQLNVTFKVSNISSHASDEALLKLQLDMLRAIQAAQISQTVDPDAKIELWSSSVLTEDNTP